jgi:hypothetical protein
MELSMESRPYLREFILEVLISERPMREHDGIFKDQPGGKPARMRQRKARSKLRREQKASRLL